MSLDPITAFFNAIPGLAGIVQPFIVDGLAQKYENEFKDRLRDWNTIVAEDDAGKRADSLQSFVLQLISDAGQTAGGVGSNIAVPMDVLAALVNIAAGKIKDDELLANMQFKQQ